MCTLPIVLSRTQGVELVRHGLVQIFQIVFRDANISAKFLNLIQKCKYWCKILKYNNSKIQIFYDQIQKTK